MNSLTWNVYRKIGTNVGPTWTCNWCFAHVVGLIVLYIKSFLWISVEYLGKSVFIWTCCWQHGSQWTGNEQHSRLLIYHLSNYLHVSVTVDRWYTAYGPIRVCPSMAYPRTNGCFPCKSWWFCDGLQVFFTHFDLQSVVEVSADLLSNVMPFWYTTRWLHVC